MRCGHGFATSTGDDSVKTHSPNVVIRTKCALPLLLSHVLRKPASRASLNRDRVAYARLHAYQCASSLSCRSVARSHEMHFFGDDLIRFTAVGRFLRLDRNNRQALEKTGCRA